MESDTTQLQDERTRILRMVEAGKLNASEAIGLLENLGAAQRGRFAQEPLQPVNAPDVSAFDDAPDYRGDGRPSWFRVRVTDLASGRSKVSVNIPFRLASWGLRVGARFNPQIENVDFRELSEMLQQDGLTGKLIDVIDEEDGEHVEIYVD